MKKIIRLTAIVMTISLTLLLVACGSTPCEHMYADGNSEYTQTMVSHKEPTCACAGYERWECSCGATFEIPIAELGHKWYTLIDRREATCTEEGYERYRCDCGATMDNPIPKCSHYWMECTQNGETVTVCSCCGIENR